MDEEGSWDQDLVHIFLEAQGMLVLSSLEWEAKEWVRMVCSGLDKRWARVQERRLQAAVCRLIETA